MSKSRMFPFITERWHPLGGECHYKCSYCWARKLAQDYNMAKYRGEPRLFDRELRRRFKPGEFVFVCDMLDLFGQWVPCDYVMKILDVCRNHSETRFLLLTKNPFGYFDFYDDIPRNCYLGYTVESNRDYPEISYAPLQVVRLAAMLILSRKDNDRHILSLGRIFISIEPILDFDYEPFVVELLKIRPWAVAVGYDNYHNKLPEPPLAKTMQLIERLETAGIRVYRKTLREKWNHD